MVSAPIRGGKLRARGVQDLAPAVLRGLWRTDSAMCRGMAMVHLLADSVLLGL